MSVIKLSPNSAVITSNISAIHFYPEKCRIAFMTAGPTPQATAEVPSVNNVDNAVLGRALVNKCIYIVTRSINLPEAVADVWNWGDMINEAIEYCREDGVENEGDYSESIITSD